MSLRAHQASDCAALADEKLPEPLDVAALTRRMAHGDDTAYRTFYGAYFERLFRYLLVVTAGDEDAAREALQSALVRVVRHIKVFPSDAANCAKSFVTREGVERSARGYVAPEVGLPWPEWIKT